VISVLAVAFSSHFFLCYANNYAVSVALIWLILWCSSTNLTLVSDLIQFMDFKVVLPCGSCHNGFAID
jgi:hypothetical protein